MKHSKQPSYDFAVGGQALIEGVMMRSHHFVSVALRHPNGSIHLWNKAFQSLSAKKTWLNLFIVRGVIHLFESMKIGFETLNYAIEINSIDPEATRDKSQATVHSTDKGKSTSAVFLSIISGVFSIAMGLVMMKVLPLTFAGFMSDISPIFHKDGFLFNAMDGLAKLTIFFTYIVIIGQIQDIRRTFQYHGAEHKSIRCYEAKEALTVENAKKHSRFHPRCGTSFLFLVMLISIFIYTLLPDASSFAERLALRIAVLPLIAGVSYEVLKWSASCSLAWWIKPLSAPGLLFQRWTTLEPDDAQLEVALASLNQALTLEKTYENS